MTSPDEGTPPVDPVEPQITEQDGPEDTGSQETPPDPQGLYAHPHLQGKGPGEVEAYVSLLEDTVRSQSTRLTEKEATPPPPPPAPEGDFFTNPQEILRHELKQAVAPIRAEIDNMKAQAKVNDAWQEIQGKFKDFDSYRPYIEQMVKASGSTPGQINASVIENFYYAAKGYVASQGGDVTPNAPAPQEKPAAPNIPQHRPSSAPLPSNKGEAAPRQLTEEERRLAREFGMSEEEYIKWGDIGDEEVVTVDLDDMKGASS